MMLPAGLFHHLMAVTAYVYTIKYIVVDMSPSSSIFNKMILL